MDTSLQTRPTTGFPLPATDLESLGIRREQIDRLVARIERHIAEGRYPGCQIALARHGKLQNSSTAPRPMHNQNE